MQPPSVVTLPTGFQREISRAQVNELPIRRYEGEVRLIESPPDLELAMADIRQESVVGFDTETRPAFRKGESHMPALAQVATARAVYLLRLQQHEFGGALAEILSSRSIVKAGVALAEDLRSLRKSIEFEEKSIVDLGRVAKRHGVRQSGLRNLAGLYLGWRIPKGTKTSNWAALRLSPQQIAYAATDAWACRELYLCFEKLGMLKAAP